MNKISIYILLLITYLGLSNSFSPTERGTPYYTDLRQFSKQYQESPVTIILLDSFSTGFFIKSYLHKVRAVYGGRPAQESMIRTNESLYNEIAPLRGMSIYRKMLGEDAPQTFPMPAGSIFVGNTNYGKWTYRNSGSKVWSFHSVYEYLPEELGWKNFKADDFFYNKVQSHFKSETPYYGENNQFLKLDQNTSSDENQNESNIFSLDGLKGYFDKILSSPWSKKG